MFQREAKAGMLGRWRIAIGLVMSSVAWKAVAATPAGTTIINVAHVGYSGAGGSRDAASNAATLVVAERLDVRLDRVGDAVVEVIAAPVAIPLVLTNRGSGEEAFVLAAGSSTPTVAVRGIAIDRDGDGRFDPAVDVTPGEATPRLAPGETLKLVVVIAPSDAAVADGTMTLTARAVTGSGEVGASFAGAGDGGGDAVVGPGGAAASVAVRFAGSVPGAPVLEKTQAVRAPDGGGVAVSGAVVAYTLTGRFPAGATRDVRIDDPLPADTFYLPGTLTLDGQVLTDAADDDPGQVANGRVTVMLGDVPAAAIRQIRFEVRLP